MNENPMTLAQFQRNAALARAASLSPKRRREIARLGAAKRWPKSRPKNKSK
jgi:hypothetical protein